MLRIEKARREYAVRLFQCLTVSTGPLLVEELADLLAIRFDSQSRPNYHADWRLVDAHEAVLSTCSSLISIVNVDGAPVVQFAHFSVKEYLTSDRLVTAGPDLSPYHVHLQEAHAVLAQACLSVLLGLEQVDKNSMKHFPLAIYAARHWVAHAQFENVSARACIEDTMDRLFDPENPYFTTWVWIYDIDYPFREHMFTMQPLEARPEAAPLYYATLCGFRSLAKRIILKHPANVNAKGGYHTTPFHAALAKGNTDVALLLLEHGADINALDNDELSPLHKASRSGRCDVVEFLLEHDANVNIQNKYGQTPLHLAACEGELEVTRVLLRHGAAVNSRSRDAWTPLMAASRYGHLNVVRLLLQNGAAVDSRNDDDWTPLTLASRYGHLDTAQLLLDQRADAHGAGGTQLDLSLANKKLERLGADTRACTCATPPDIMSHSRERDSNIPDNDGKTSLHIASEEGDIGAVQSLLDHGADVNERDESHQTPLHVASTAGKLGVAKLLIKHSADVNSRDKSGWTPLHKASRFERLDIAKLLLDHDADVDAQKQDDWTPLHLAVGNHYLEIVKVLLERCARVDLLNDEGRTPHDVALRRGAGDIADLLSKYMAHGA